MADRQALMEGLDSRRVEYYYYGMRGRSRSEAAGSTPGYLLARSGKALSQQMPIRYSNIAMFPICQTEFATAACPSSRDFGAFLKIDSLESFNHTRKTPLPVSMLVELK